MILTGSEIKKYVENGDIVIEPFNEDQLNPNSYNYRLGETLTFKEDDGKYRTVCPVSRPGLSGAYAGNARQPQMRDVADRPQFDRAAGTVFAGFGRSRAYRFGSQMDAGTGDGQAFPGISGNDHRADFILAELWRRLFVRGRIFGLFLPANLENGERN